MAQGRLARGGLALAPRAWLVSPHRMSQGRRAHGGLAPTHGAISDSEWARAAARAAGGARVSSFVLSTIDKSSCCFGKYSEPLAVANWISQVTLVLVYAL